MYTRIYIWLVFDHTDAGQFPCDYNLVRDKVKNCEVYIAMVALDQVKKGHHLFHRNKKVIFWSVVQKMLQEMAEVCSKSTFDIEDIFSEDNPEYLTQF